MRKSKLYVYCGKKGNEKEIVFKAFNKTDIMDYLETTRYEINYKCWEESSLNINTYHDGKIDVDLTEKSSHSQPERIVAPIILKNLFCSDLINIEEMIKAFLTSFPNPEKFSAVTRCKFQNGIIEVSMAKCDIKGHILIERVA